MPNGGSDCCATCWFNRANGGKQGSVNHDHSIPSYCEIRDLDIPDPGYTYCANHPYHLRRRIAAPIGPVYVHQWHFEKDPETGDTIHDSSRVEWQPAPDSEEIRRELLRLAGSPPEADHYPFYSPPIYEVAIFQLVELKDERVIAALENLAAREDMAEERADILELVETIRDKLSE